MAESSAGYFTNGLISGSSFANLHYPVTGGFVYNLFDTASTYWYDSTTLTTTNNNFITGSFTTLTFPTYTISQLGIYQIRANFDISSIFKDNTSTGSYTFKILKNNTTTLYSSTTVHDASVNAWKYFSIMASTSPISFASGDTIKFQLQLSGFSTNNFTASISSGSVYSVPVISNNVYYTVYGTSSPFLSGSIDTDGDGLNDTLIFSPLISPLFGVSTFHPEYMSGSSIPSSSLYPKYGSIDYVLNPQKNDLVIFKSYDPIYGLTQYTYNILSTYNFNGKYYISLNGDLPSYLSIGAYNTSSFDEFLILKQLPDETSVLLSFTKRIGQTSLGLLLPQNLHPDVLKNIDTITQQIKTKLLNTTTT